MASRQTWETFNSEAIIKTDEEVLSMVKDLVETIHAMERIYGNQEARLTVRALLLDWQALSSIANSRGLTYEHP